MLSVFGDIVRMVTPRKEYRYEVQPGNIKSPYKKKNDLLMGIDVICSLRINNYSFMIVLLNIVYTMLSLE